MDKKVRLQGCRLFESEPKGFFDAGGDGVAITSGWFEFMSEHRFLRCPIESRITTAFLERDAGDPAAGIHLGTDQTKIAVIVMAYTKINQYKSLIF